VEFAVVVGAKVVGFVVVMVRVTLPVVDGAVVLDREEDVGAAVVGAAVELVEAEEPPPASTAAQKASVAGRTWPVATSAPQARMTQLVAAPMTAFLFAQMHL